MPLKSEIGSFACGLEAVCLDVLGTLVELKDPAPRLRTELLERAGVEVTEDAARRAIRSEMRYYLDHHLEGHDPDSLQKLRDACATVVLEKLGLSGSAHGVVRTALLRSLSFVAYPDAAPALRELRARGLRLVAVSNWDISLPWVLARVGLLEFLDAVVASAQVGVAKPNSYVFAHALSVIDCPPQRAIHVGDSPDLDICGAKAAGLRAVLLDRQAGTEQELPRPGANVEVIHTLTQLGALPLKH